MSNVDSTRRYVVKQNLTEKSVDELSKYSKQWQWEAVYS